MNYIAIPGLKRSLHSKQSCVDIPEIRIQDIIETIEKYFGVSFVTLQQKTRRREVCYARQVCMYFLCAKTHLSLKSIGEMFGDRDHTSVIHSRELIKDLMFSDDKVKKDILILSDKL